MVAFSLQDLFLDAILPFFVKVGKVRRAKVPPLEVLGMPLLAALPYLLDLLCGMLSNARIITVWADDDVLPLIAAALIASIF
jgi:hypothetical protein